MAFSKAGYDSVGVREIALAARTDPAMVSRLFGSKENLFTLIASEAFRVAAPFDGPVRGMGQRIAADLLGPVVPPDPDEFDNFAFLLRSIGSPVAAPILSAAIHQSFIQPLSRRMSGREAEQRAALLTAYVLGVAVLRVGLGSPAIERSGPEMVSVLLGEALQRCLTPAIP
ncbi:TetR family transcriptional regulator [Acetobacteraceae bacterium KSS12]|uniref:TetR family transcriptional regulator n=2 Tax=Rhizosaccharibacter radicis TaxID=2782605 RepID=A0ABT1VZ55_9PROT|nr:TetR family transcriptional regulator [Acetobacteraceae bacterium KSS12]